MRISEVAGIPLTSNHPSTKRIYWDISCFLCVSVFHRHSILNGTFLQATATLTGWGCVSPIERYFESTQLRDEEGWKLHSARKLLHGREIWRHYRLYNWHHLSSMNSPFTQTRNIIQTITFPSPQNKTKP